MRLLDKSSARAIRRLVPTGLIVAAIVTFCPLADPCHAAILQGMNIVSTDTSTDVTLRLNEKVRYQFNLLRATDTSPARCYVDLFSTSRDQSLPSWLPVNDQRVAKIRSGLFPTKLRIVFDLLDNHSCSVATLTTEPLQILVSIAEPASLSPGQGTLISPVLTETDLVREDAPPVVTEPQHLLASDVVPVQPAGLKPQPQDMPSAERGEMSAWGWLQLFSAYDTQKDFAEDSRLSRLKGRLGADWNKDLGPEASLKLYTSIDLDRIFYDSDLADEETEIILHETYVQYAGAAWDMSFGKQRVRWGKSDQLSPVDSLNPQDFRQFIIVDLEERALPSWMLRNRWHGESTSLETIVQPWFQESELEYFDSDWALYRNLRQAIIASPLASPGLKDYVRHIRVEEKKPDSTLENMAAAARFSWQTEQTDFAVSYHYGWETLPTVTSFPVKNLLYTGDPDADPAQILASAVFTNERVQAEYKRQQTVGFEWETVLDPIGFRGEIAHIDHVALMSGDLTSKRKPVTHLVSGIDYTSENDWYFNIQGSWYHIHSFDDEILYFEENTVSALGEIRKPVWRGNLELALQYNYTLTDRSSYLQPSVTLKYFPNLEGEVGANIFSGDGDTLLGSYGRADQVYGVLKYSF